MTDTRTRTQTETSSAPNVLLLIMDSVRAHNTSLHGHERETTPFLDSFADRATTYTQARAPGRWSLPSHASLFTGYHVAEHRLYDEGRRLEPGHDIFGELSETFGYDTGLFSYNGYINGRVDTGLSEGFDTVEGYREPLFPDAANPAGLRGEKRTFLRMCLDSGQPLRSVANGLLMKLGWDHPGVVPDRFLRNTIAGQTPDDVYVDLFLDWHRDRTGPWAACLNFMCTHNAFEPDPEHDRWGTNDARKLQRSLKYGNWEYLSGQRPLSELREFEPLFDGTIHQTDAMIRRIVEAIAERGDLVNTLVVITGDHGEGFGAPSRIRDGLPMVQHVIGAHEVLLHVPLVVNYPGQTDPVTVTDVASLTRFPNVVRDCVDGTFDDHAGFAPDDGRVFASDHGLNEVNREKMKDYCDENDWEKFEDETLVLYENADEGVRKTMTWKGRSVSFEIDDDLTVTAVDGDRSGAVRAAFDSLTDAGAMAHTDDTVDEGTLKQLEKLGYR